MIFLTEANCFAFLLARAIVANYTRHQSELIKSSLDLSDHELSHEPLI